MGEARAAAGAQDQRRRHRGQRQTLRDRLGHRLSSLRPGALPAGSNALSNFAGQYDYFFAKALIFDGEQDSFRTVAAMGNMLRGANYGRCP